MSTDTDRVLDPRHGPLPVLLLVLTFVTGMVDAVSILALGRVFVANMTGNVVFIGFALAHAPGFALDASVIALAAFLVGAAAGGILDERIGHRGRLLGFAALAEGGLLLLATVLAVVALDDTMVRDVIVALTAIALGGQNAAVRKLGVPDFTTTVLTMTLTGIAADLRQRRPKVALRRTFSVLAICAGAAVGALLTLHVRPTVALGAATVAVLGVAAVALARSRRPAPWQHV